jgi:hypothetical protein
LIATVPSWNTLTVGWQLGEVQLADGDFYFTKELERVSVSIEPGNYCG